VTQGSNHPLLIAGWLPSVGKTETETAGLRIPTTARGPAAARMGSPTVEPGTLRRGREDAVSTAIAGTADDRAGDRGAQRWKERGLEAREERGEHRGENLGLSRGSEGAAPRRPAAVTGAHGFVDRPQIPPSPDSDRVDGVPTRPTALPRPHVSPAPSWRAEAAANAQPLVDPDQNFRTATLSAPGGREGRPVPRDGDGSAQSRLAGTTAGSPERAGLSLASQQGAGPSRPSAALIAAQAVTAAAPRRKPIRTDRERPAPGPAPRHNLPVEVTVEIGAIEIVSDTAVRRPAPATAPLSLSDYLRTRPGR
jgi:hypothetical protein